MLTLSPYLARKWEESRRQATRDRNLPSAEELDEMAEELELREMEGEMEGEAEAFQSGIPIFSEEEDMEEDMMEG